MSDRTSQVSSGQLHEEVQRWIWSQGWDKLRPIQEQAIALSCLEREVLQIQPSHFIRG
jgi:Lhr-like helicase